MNTNFWMCFVLFASFTLTACGVEHADDDAPIPVPCSDCDDPEPEPEPVVDPYCGDGVCNDGEDYNGSCPDDCPEPVVDPYCGDGVCDDDEDYDSCPDDCDEPDPEPYCGDGTCDEDEDFENCSDDCDESVTVVEAKLPCVFRSPEPYVWDFNSFYVADAVEGSAEFFTDTNATRTPEITDDYNDETDGWLGMYFEVPEGAYRFSYKGYQSNSYPEEAWAMYGGKNVLSRLTVECREFIQCNWIDDDGEETDCPNGECHCNLAVYVDDDGNIEPNGNADLYDFE